MKLLWGWTLFFAVAASAQNWQQQAAVPAPGRDDAIAFALNGYGYLVTGNQGGFSESNLLWQYDPQNDSWSQKTPFPGTPRQYAASFVLGGKAYIVMGISESGIPLKDVWSYEPLTDTWQQLHDFPGEARWSLFAFATVARATIGTGTTTTGLLKDCWQYVPAADAWTPIADYPGGVRRETVAFAIGEKGVVGLGYAGFGGSDFRSDCFAWNELARQWSPLPDFPGGAWAYANAVATNAYGYIGTGLDQQNGFHAACYAFDPLSVSWTAIGDLPLNIKGMSAFAIGDTPYFLTGISEDFIRVSSVWKLADAWKTDEPYTVVYPNPAEGPFVVKALNGSKMELFTTDGRRVRESVIEHQQTAWMEGLRPGTYLLRVTSPGKTFTETVVVH